MKTVTPADIQTLAGTLNIAATVETKGGKPEWTLTSPNGKVSVLKGNGSTLSALELMADLAGNKPTVVTVEKVVPKVQEKVFQNPKATTRIMMTTVDHPDWPLEKVVAAVKAEGCTVSNNVASVVYYDSRKTMAYLNRRQ